MCLILVGVSFSRTVLLTLSQRRLQFEESKLARSVNKRSERHIEISMIFDLQNNWSAPARLYPWGGLMDAQAHSGVGAATFDQSNQMLRNSYLFVSHTENKTIRRESK